MAKLLLTQGYPDAQRGRSRHYYDTAKVYVYVGQCQGEYCYHLAGLTSWHFLRACFHAALSTLLSFLVSGDVRFQESAITSCHYLASCVSERRMMVQQLLLRTCHWQQKQSLPALLQSCGLAFVAPCSSFFVRPPGWTGLPRRCCPWPMPARSCYPVSVGHTVPCDILAAVSVTRPRSWCLVFMDEHHLSSMFGLWQLVECQTEGPPLTSVRPVG